MRYVGAESLRQEDIAGRLKEPSHFFFGSVTCGILVPRPGIESNPGPQQ